MDNYLLPFNFRDAVLILVFLTGIVGGIMLTQRGQSKIGMYVLAGCILLALDPLTEFVIFNFLSPNFGTDSTYQFFNWAYACISAPATGLGTLSLLAGIYYAVQDSQIGNAGKPSGNNQPVYMENEK